MNVINDVIVKYVKENNVIKYGNYGFGCHGNQYQLIFPEYCGENLSVWAGGMVSSERVNTSRPIWSDIIPGSVFHHTTINGGP